MKRNIEPTAISPEMIGAYLEGNLSGEELKTFEKLMTTNPELSNMVDDVRGLEMDMAASISEDYPDFMEAFELPLVADLDIQDSLDVVDYDIELTSTDDFEQPTTDNDHSAGMIDSNTVDTLEDTDHTFDTDHGDASDISSGIE